MFQSDTIAAIATAMSNAGIGIIRISGPEAIAIADRVFRGKQALAQMQSHTISYGHIVQGEKRLDEVLVSLFRNPRSYTREDLVEIHCHGGRLVLLDVLECIIHAGARVAEPGEFTKRAFLNGRIDMAQAESVMDLIQAENRLSVRNSLEQLSGNLSTKIKQMREQILYELAFIESALDDPEHYSLEEYSDHFIGVIDELLAKCQKMISSYQMGARLKEGILTVILGRPNAGKSSLLNALSGRDRAIVTDIPGTTRDLLEEEVQIRDISLRLIDTAGIRETQDQIEQIGVEKAWSSVDRADLVILVLDGSHDFTNEERELLEQLHQRNFVGRTIFLLNKMDLALKREDRKRPEQLAEILRSFAEKEENCKWDIIPISAKESEGLEILADRIEERFLSQELREDHQIWISNARHKQALEEAGKSLSLVRQGLHEEIPEDLLAVDLMNAYENLGFITGESLEDDLTDKIFSTFCMGK